MDGAEALERNVKVRVTERCSRGNPGEYLIVTLTEAQTAEAEGWARIVGSVSRKKGQGPWTPLGNLEVKTSGQLFGPRKDHHRGSV
jgi:hypothetical protein